VMDHVVIPVVYESSTRIAWVYGGEAEMLLGMKF
jgi:hypothetical protein